MIILHSGRYVPWTIQGRARPSQVPDNLRERLPSSARWRRSPRDQRLFDSFGASAVVMTTIQIGEGSVH